MLDINNDADLNSSRPDSEKRVFFSNMIYIGDGLTDVPCMKLVKQSGGHSIAIYHPGEHYKTLPLLKHERVDWMFEADYSEGSELDRTMKLLLSDLGYYNKLREINELQKKEFDKYKAMSPWRDEKEKRWMPLKFCLEKMAIKLVVSMGLRKSDYIVENRYIELS